jgi:hypothetical protein
MGPDRNGKAVLTRPLLSLAVVIRKMASSSAAQKGPKVCALDVARFGPQTVHCGAVAGQRLGWVAAYTMELRTCGKEQVSRNIKV